VATSSQIRPSQIRHPMRTWTLLLCAAHGGAAALLRPLGPQLHRAAPPTMCHGPSHEVAYLPPQQRARSRHRRRQ